MSSNPATMVIDVEDDTSDAMSPLSLDEDVIAFLKNPYSQLGETVEEIGSASETLNADCDIQYDGHVPPKKRHYFGTSYTCSSFEQLEEHACIVCDVADDCVVPCSGNECPLAVHRKCAELDCEDPAISYCPFCWFKDQAARSMALRTMVVAAAKALVQYGCTKSINSRHMVIARENIQLEHGCCDQSLSVQLHENLAQLQDVIGQLKAHNNQLEESIDQFVDMEKACEEASINIQLEESVDQLVDMEKTCEEASIVVNDHPKRVLWTVEEEDMLKVGVETFSAKINKNMPWYKILKMGKGVFHNTRTSSDLKDKWRNMIRM